MKTKHSTFSDIYNDLIDELTLSWMWKIAVPILLVIIALSISYQMAAVTAVDNAVRKEISQLSTGLLVFFVLLAVLLGIILGTLSNLSGVNYKTSTLMARLIISTKSPFSKNMGLSHEEIQHLKIIGQTEQSAAGWQGAFISVAIIWFLAENIGLFSKSITALAEVAKQSQSISIFPSSGLGWSIVWIIICLIEAGISFILFKYIYDFLGNEPSNRAIIKACEDAQALLEKLKLKKNSRFSIKQKKLIAEYCRCSYIPAKQESRSLLRWKFKVQENNGKDFLLMTLPGLEAMSKSDTHKEKAVLENSSTERK